MEDCWRGPQEPPDGLSAPSARRTDESRLSDKSRRTDESRLIPAVVRGAITGPQTGKAGRRVVIWKRWKQPSNFGANPIRSFASIGNGEEGNVLTCPRVSEQGGAVLLRIRIDRAHTQSHAKSGTGELVFETGSERCEEISAKAPRRHQRASCGAGHRPATPCCGSWLLLQP